MSEQMKLSIIIPAYNAEPYLAELLDCLAGQMREGVEVIVIDDGSEKKVTSKYTGWLRIIRQKNKGAGAARNRANELKAKRLVSITGGEE